MALMARAELACRLFNHISRPCTLNASTTAKGSQHREAHISTVPTRSGDPLRTKPSMRAARVDGDVRTQVDMGRILSTSKARMGRQEVKILRWERRRPLRKEGHSVEDLQL